MSANFHDDLDYSKRIEATPLWTQVYDQHFPDYQSLTIVDDLTLQKQGVDRIIVTEVGNRWYLEEKADKWPPKNLFLEHISSAEHKTPGWMEKDTLTDFLGYAYPAYGVAYVFRYKHLKKAWENNKREWIDRYEKAVQNPGYTTKGCAVPIVEVMAALLKVVQAEILAVREVKVDIISNG